MPPQAVDRMIYIASQNRTIRIVTASDDPWAYDLHWDSVAHRPQGVEELIDLVALDAIFDTLKISQPSLGRDVLNAVWRWGGADKLHASRPIHSTERRRRIDAPTK